MRLDEALEVAALVQNGCDESTHRFWYWAITEKVPRTPGGVVIEVGCKRGGGSTTLAAACQERVFELHCVDTWFTGAVDQRDWPEWEEVGEGYPIFTQHVDQLRRAGLNYSVVRHVGDSWRVGGTLDVPCVFLWIDAMHRWPYPFQDWLAFNRLVVPGGIVGFHDIEVEGVKKTIEELELGGHLMGWKELEIPDPSWILPEEQKRITKRIGFATRAWEKI